MRAFFLLLFWNLNCGVFAQYSQTYSSDSDTLRKYSYFIMGVDFKSKSSVVPIASGSGYFVRHDGKIFFITANHVLTGCGSTDTCTFSTKPDSYPAEMTIFLTSSNGLLNLKYITINISYLHFILPCTDFSLTPDVAAYELRSNPSDTIYSIEKFLNKEIPKSKGMISIYGYPGYANEKSFGYALENSAHLALKKYEFYEFYKHKACGGRMTIDSQDYVINPIDSFQTNLFGFSGSPAFIENKKTKKWHFMGTFVGSVENDKYLFIKPKYTYTSIGVSR